MDVRNDLRWGVILALGAAGLIRPVLSIAGVYEAADENMVGTVLDPLVTTAVISALWVGAVLWLRLPNPFLTLVCVGGAYGVLAIVLQQIMWLVLPGGPPSEVPQGVLLIVSWFAIMVVNLLWGAILGLVATGISRISGRTAGRIQL